MMNIPAEFDSIRPYSPEELPQAYEELIADTDFRQAAVAMMSLPFEMIAAKMRQCKTNLEFQKTFFYDLIKQLLRKNSEGLTEDFSALTDRSRRYTFVSNHRDIVMDPALLSIALIDAQWSDTTEIAIGDNLLVYPWIRRLVRILKAFIVVRGLTGRKQLETLNTLSRYIHFAISEKHENVWIAQRQGRAKDANDTTQESILKMLSIAGEGTPEDRLAELNIVPLAFSYEYDPCDFLKAGELQRRRDEADFHKAEGEDMISMKTGIFGYKGRVHVKAAPCINTEMKELASKYPRKTDFFPALKRCIDKHIFSNYKLYAVNYIALDCLEDSRRFEKHYTDAEREKFEQYLRNRLDKIELPDKDEPFLSEMLLKMYANPLINYLAVKE